jgi:hypothetical protein
MKPIWLLRIATLAIALGGVGAQRVLAQGDTQSAPASDAATAKKPSYQPLTIGVGWADWDLRGGAAKFLQYATPPRGFFLNELRYVPWNGDPASYGRLVLRGLGGDDFHNEASFTFFHGATSLDMALNQAHFYEPTPLALPNNDRELQDVAIKQKITPTLALGLRYSMDQQNSYFEAPSLPLHQRTRFSNVNIEGKLGPGFLGVSFTDWRYFDRTGIRPDMTLKRWQASYLWTPSSSVAVGADFVRHNIEQTGAPSSRVEQVSFDTSLALGPDTDLDLDYFNQTLHLPVVQNAYDRKQRGGGGRIVQHWPGWSVSLSIREREAQRVRGDQSYVDVPRWTTFDGRLYGRLSRQTRLTVWGYVQTLANPPVMTTEDARTLFWKQRSYAQVKIETGTGLANGYVVGAWERLDNSDRSAFVSIASLTTGGNWQITPKFSAFAEYVFEGWNAKNDVTDFPTIGRFAPNDREASVGASWQIDPRTSLYMSLSDVATTNDNPLLLRNGNTRGEYFTLSLRHQLRSGFGFGLVLSPWRYRDRVDSLMNYNTTDIMLTADGRF